MTTIKSFTSLEQSKKLAEILPTESADMQWFLEEDYEIVQIKEELQDWGGDCTIPCWSLARLLGVVSEEVSLNSFKDGNWNAMVQQNGKMIYGDADNPVDACYELILKLNELKML